MQGSLPVKAARKETRKAKPKLQSGHESTGHGNDRDDNSYTTPRSTADTSVTSIADDLQLPVAGQPAKPPFNRAGKTPRISKP